MAYSRFCSTSTWYTFWRSCEENCDFKFPSKRLKYEQCFEICDFPSYNIYYYEIKIYGIDKIIKNVEEFYSKSHNINKFKDFSKENKKPIYEKTTYNPKNPTKEELQELKGYILEWVKDVDDHFKFKTFFLYNWYYPIRNKIKNKLKK